METIQNLPDFQTILTARLKDDPEAQENFNMECRKAHLEVIVNEILCKTGNEKFCVSLVEVDK